MRMKDIRVYDKFHIDIERDAVLRLMDCYPDSPVYEETVEEYEEIKPMMLAALRPRGIIALGKVPEGYEVEEVLEVGSPVIYTIVTIGEKASSMSNQFFAEGDYLKGMIADVMADSCVFAMESDLRGYVREVCKEHNCGISHRYEAPVDIPMVYQLLAFQQTEAKKYLNMNITSGYMLDPLKSNCQVFALSADTTEFKVEHDCRHCGNLSCKLRNIPDVSIFIYDRQGEYKKKITCSYEENILEAYTRQGGYMTAPCGGHGTCGKCKIRVRKGMVAITKVDETYFTKEELEQGYRLACKAYPEMDCEIELQQAEENDFDILGHGLSEVSVNRTKEDSYRIAIDIGTTTLAISLVGDSTSQVIDTYTEINHQRAYGADVISRIQASNDGKRDTLRISIQRDLLKGMREILEKNNIETTNVCGVTVAANTTMTHLLLGFSCVGLGVVPFTPVNIGIMEHTFAEVFPCTESWCKELSEIKVVFLPGISTFVGGDIVSGIYAKRIHESAKYQILVDLGTNGEMAIGNKDKILVTSTAMGPACEGGNIVWGMGGVSGAICNVNIDARGTVEVTTIGDKLPIGICGTGVLETVAELVKQEWIDETGLLDDTYFDNGFPLAKTKEGESIVFTQKDIREIQLAKSAVRAGVETLIKKAGIGYHDIQHLYLAGGFGFHLDKVKAVAIGLFPQELLDRIEVVGNTALEGAISYTHNDREVVQQIVDISEEISLSVDKGFNELYVEHMFFEG